MAFAFIMALIIAAPFVGLMIWIYLICGQGSLS